MMGHPMMDRRSGMRLSTDLAVPNLKARAVELSVDGALLRRTRRRQPPLVESLEIELDGVSIATRARTVWTRGDLQAVRFIGLGEVDRLEIAEHLDRLERRRRRRA